jgi:hypothetical protein
MLSNGEYVVNAASTKSYLPFLQAINSNKGKLVKLAAGGQVGASNPQAIVQMAAASRGGSNKSEFNINIQGDVSRQTRKEIVRMIPEITSGVNSTNKERRF